MDFSKYKEKKAKNLIKIYKIGGKPIMQQSAFDPVSGDLVADAPYPIDLTQVKAKLDAVQEELTQVQAFYEDLLNAPEIEGAATSENTSPANPAPQQE